MARCKRYFWDMKHHRYLEEVMGLKSPESPDVKRLREACGMPSFLVTKGLTIGILIAMKGYPCKLLPLGWKGLPETDTRIESELSKRLEQAHN